MVLSTATSSGRTSFCLCCRYARVCECVCVCVRVCVCVSVCVRSVVGAQGFNVHSFHISHKSCLHFTQTGTRTKQSLRVLLPPFDFLVIIVTVIDALFWTVAVHTRALPSCAMPTK
jgi:hypothetical protein